MDGTVATVVALFSGLCIALVGAFLKLAIQIGKLAGAIETLPGRLAKAEEKAALRYRPATMPRKPRKKGGQNP